MEIAAPDGRFRVIRPEARQLKPGEQLTFIIGADRVRIDDRGSNAPNRVEGTVSAIEFVGSMATVYLQLPGGSEFRLQKPETGLENLGAGSRLAVNWNPRDAFVLPDRP